MSIRARNSDYVATRSAPQYVHFEVEFDFNQPYVPTEEDILDILCALEVYEFIEDDS